MFLSIASLRARLVLGAGLISIAVGSTVAGVAGPALAVATPAFSISPNTGSPGDKINVSGTGCIAMGGVKAQVFVYQGAKPVPVGPLPPGSLLGASLVVNPDGTWASWVNVPDVATAGPISLVANCASANTLETATPIFWYDQVGIVTVPSGTTTTTTIVPATTTTSVPATTTTSVPATTTTSVPATTTTSVPATTTTADPGAATTSPAKVTTAAPAPSTAVAVAVAATPTYTG